MSKQFKTAPECIYGSPCKLICVNPQCRKPGFICENGMINKQQCALFHQNCQKMKWSELQNILYDNPHVKIPQFAKMQQEMEMLFTDMLKRLKQQHVKFKIWTRTYGYSQQLMNFIQIINEGNFNQISGLYMNQILSEVFMKDDNKVKQSFNLQNIQKVQKQIHGLFQKITSVYKSPTKLSGNSLQTPNQNLEQKKIVLDSKITEQVQYIKSLFLKSKPKQFKLLYRASDCDFSVAQFHKRCDQVPNTLLLVKTQYGKVIGGFTPLPWNSSKKHWAADKSLSSFIFSLDMRERFQLNLVQFAVACNPDKGPIFGCCDICIVDKSNVQKSNAEFPISYNNFKYARNSDTSIVFSGSSKGRFCTKQWEIFHIEFQTQ